MYGIVFPVSLASNLLVVSIDFVFVISKSSWGVLRVYKSRILLSSNRDNWLLSFLLISILLSFILLCYSSTLLHKNSDPEQSSVVFIIFILEAILMISHIQDNVSYRNLSYVTLTMLKYNLSVPGYFRTFYHECIWIKSFSRCIEMVLWFFLCFILYMYCIVCIALHMLNHPCIPGVNPIWSWCIILMSCKIW